MMQQREDETRKGEEKKGEEYGRIEELRTYVPRSCMSEA
jgi:hypothetical protein